MGYKTFRQTPSGPLNAEATMKKVKRVCIIICPDKHGIHKGSVDGPYVRYVILQPESGPALWIDDPSYEDIKNIIYDTGTSAIVVKSQCQWCSAHERAT